MGNVTVIHVIGTDAEAGTQHSFLASMSVYDVIKALAGFAGLKKFVAYIDDDAYPDPHWLHFLAHTYLTTDFVGVGGEEFRAAAADLFELLQAAGVVYAPPLLVGSTFYFSILLLCEEGLLNAIQRDPNPFAYLCKFEKL